MLNIILLSLTLALAMCVFYASILSKQKLAVTFLTSTFSLTLVFAYSILLAIDVALTEVSLNVFLTTAILMIALQQADDNKATTCNHFVTTFKNAKLTWILILITFIVSVVFLTHIFQSFGNIGSSKNLLNSDYGYYYIKSTHYQIGTENIITAIITSYRGFDTMFETIVIAITALSIYFFSRNPKPQKDCKHNSVI
jgi:multicomponent Na+:H+ antiporter subunit B